MIQLFKDNVVKELVIRSVDVKIRVSIRLRRGVSYYPGIYIQYPPAKILYKKILEPPRGRSSLFAKKTSNLQIHSFPTPSSKPVDRSEKVAKKI